MFDSRIVLYDNNGDKRAEVYGITASNDKTGYISLGLRRELNGIGICTFTLNIVSTLIGEIDYNDEVEVWLRDYSQGIDWYKEFDGIIRDIEMDTEQTTIVRYRAYDPKMLLMWRHVLYPSNIPDRSEFDGYDTESTAKLIVKYNCTSSGTTGDGRLRNAADWLQGFTLSTDNPLTAGSFALKCAQDNVFTTIQNITGKTPTNETFDVVKTSPLNYDFIYYSTSSPQGTDRTAEVTFSTTFDNMVSPKYAYNKFNEKSQIIIGGQGEGKLRTFAQDSGVSADDIEVFVPYTNTKDSAVLAKIAGIKTVEYQAREQLTFRVRQQSKIYGRDYFLGDHLKAFVFNNSFGIRLWAVNIEFASDGLATVTPEFLYKQIAS